MSYTKAYTEMRGVDLSSERSECDPRRFNHLINMWRDYKSQRGAAVETAPGFRKLANVVADGSEKKVNAFHYLPGETPYLLVHVATQMIAYPVTEVEVEDEEQGEEQGEETEKKTKFSLGDPKTVAYSWNNAKSSSVYHYGKLYIVDGENYRSIKNNGEIITVDNVSSTPYIPTTFSNEIAYEQRNMLTDYFVQKNTVIGVGGNLDDIVIKDPCVTVREFKINGTEKYLFQFVVHSKIIDKGTADSIQDYALYKYNSKTEVLTTFDNYAYTDAWWLNEQFNDPNALEDEDDGYTLTNPVMKLGTLQYDLVTGDERETKRIDVKYVEHDYNNGVKLYSIVDDACKYYAQGALGLRAKLEAADKTNDKFYISSLTWYRAPLQGGRADIELHGVAESGKFAAIKDISAKDYLTGNPDFSENSSAEAAIRGCTLITEFDGRLFLSGNPDLPNSVFYTHRRGDTGLNDPSYIGVYNYINDGTDNTPIVAMMTTPTQLIVLKDHSAKGESAYYHTAQYNSGSDELVNLQPRIYPREEGIPSLGCLGVAVNFADDPVFITKNGLDAVGKSQVNLERSIAHRSSLVDAGLLNEDLDNAFAAEWQGYLLLFMPSGRVYLADSRQLYSDQQGLAQYEWFVWDEVGEYVGQTDRYHYTTGDNPFEETSIDGYLIGTKPSRDYVDDVKNIKEAELTKSTATGKVDAKYIVESVDTGTYAFLVDTDGEQTGGNFSPATAAIVVEDVLIFGTKSGGLFVFNTDLRDNEGYFPQDTYHRNNRGYKVACATKSDNCGRTNLTKSTLRGSFVLKTKAFPSVSVDVRVRTDRDGWKTVENAVVGRLARDLADLDFGAWSFRESDESFSVIREREKKWVEKQLLLENWCYLKPFGFISATYDFDVAGKVKIR